MQGFIAISTNKMTRIENYEILHTIGEGQFGKVKLARHVLTKGMVAIKVIEKTHQNFSDLQELFREVNSMRMVNHPNIVKLLEVTDTPDSLFIVMEYLSGGDLFTYLEVQGCLTEGEARGAFRQLVSALQHCHQQGVVHRDVKLSSLLLDANNNIKISEFGLSNQWHPGKKLDTFCGSPAFTAPELFLRLPYTGPEVDVWSLGVVLYTMVTGSLPFRGRDFWELRQCILRGQYHVPKHLSSEITNLIQRMLTLNPTNRGTLDDVWQHPWVNMGREEPLPPACEEYPGVTAEMVLGWWRDQIQGWLTSSGSDRDEPKVGARTIIVRPAISSDLSSQEHTPPASPEVSMLIPDWLWDTIQQQESQESRETTREPATPPPCPEARTVTPSSAPSTHDTHDDSIARATDHAGDRHDTCGASLTCDTCDRCDSSHTCDTSATWDTRNGCDASSACDSCNTSGASFTCDACSTCDTSFSHDALSTPDSTGACSTEDARGSRDTCGASVASDTCLASDTSGAHGTHNPHATVTQDTRGT